MRRIVLGDEVVVIRGNDKGKRGKVTRVLRDKNAVVVSGARSVKRHLKRTAQRPGGILEVEAPLPISAVMPVDPEGGKPTRVKYVTKKDRKQRVAKSGAVIEAKES
jgi:large subunit ribosomal protein L24